ncbi:hypothetical protein CBS101457_004485 [Exobasidium rhododendri]|nr:hypothetical protein CBS101457_004485 [Exobasidium rhododendri]
MRLFHSSLVVVILSLVGLALAAAGETGKVLDLTKSKDFDAAIGKGKGALVEFFAPWCGHCKKLAPTFEDLASEFEGKKDSVIIAKVDADNNRELGQRFGVKGFPTLMWFKPNSLTPETYTGPRDLNGLKNYVTEMSGQVGVAKSSSVLPPPKAVQLNAANFESIVMDPKKDVFVEFYAPWCGHCKNLAPIYEKVASAFENEPNCIVAQLDADNADNKAFASKYGVSGYPTLMMFPKGSSEKSSEAYMQSRTEEDLISYLNTKCMTYRTVGGALSELAGRMPLLDTLASKFFMAKADERSSVWEEAKTFVTKASQGANATAEKNTAANYYVKVMDKTIKEPGYLEKETRRLTSLMQKHLEGTSKLAAAKFDDLKRRSNVLTSFAFKEMSEKTRDAADKIIKGHNKDEL